MADANQRVMLVGIDNSEHSFYALNWVLDHFFVPSSSKNPFNLVMVHAQPVPSSVLGLAGPVSADVMPVLQADLKKTSQKVVEKAREICKNNRNVLVEVIEGDARNVMCEAVEKHHASMLVMGSHGYGPMKRALLGSVSDHCAHNAHCSVLIVKQHKPKH